MNEDYQNPETKKATVDIEESLYLFVKGNFYHGQLTKLIRNVFSSVKILILDENIKDVIMYISGQADLTLPKIEIKKE